MFSEPGCQRRTVPRHCRRPDYCLIEDARLIGQLNHLAIATSDLASAVNIYENVLGASVSEPTELPEHGVTVVFVDLGNTKIELLSPLGNNSPIEKFLQRNPAGGIHHVCFEVDDIIVARDKLLVNGARVLGNAKPKIGAHGKPVIFLHPGIFVER